MTEALNSSLIQSPLPKNNTRLKSIDIYRGFNLFAMIIVNNQQADPIWPLKQTEWNGLSTADLIFPSFLFIMGFAVPLAVKAPVNMKKILFRVSMLFLIGFAIHLVETKFDFSTVRIMGVLQRLSICYFMVILVHLATGYADEKKIIYGNIFVLFVALVYMSMMLSYTSDNPESRCNRTDNLRTDCNFGYYIDLKVFTRNHMYPYEITEPEGLWSTLSAFLTCYGGYYFCLIMKKNKNNKTELIKTWLGLAFVSIIFSLPVSLIMPYNKKLWSTSFALVTIGIAGVFLSGFTYLIDVVGTQNQGNRIGKGIEIVTSPFMWLGMNTMIIYILSELIPATLSLIVFKDGDSFWGKWYQNMFASWITNQSASSILFSLQMVLILTLIAYVMFRFKIFVRL